MLPLGSDSGTRLLGEPLGDLLEGASVHIAEVVHRTELGTAHEAELGGLEVVVRQGLIVHGPGGLRVEGEVELPPPVEGVVGPGELIVPLPGAVPSARNVCGVGGDAALLYMFSPNYSRAAPSRARHRRWPGWPEAR